jgi:hypothetical protein
LQEKKNKLSTYTNDMDSLRFAALCRGEDFRVSSSPEIHDQILDEINPLSNF